MRCGTCAKTTQVVAPWARPNSGFSLLMEALRVTLCKAMAVFQVAQLLGVSDGRVWHTLVSLRRSGTRSGGLLDRHCGRSRRDRLTARDTTTLAYFTTSMPSMCSTPAKGEKPKSWLNLPMHSRLMAPVPRTSARSVWIGQQATKLACVSICPGRQSPSISLTLCSSSTRRLTKFVTKKSKGPRSCGVHATTGSRTSTLGVTARKPQFAELKSRNLKTHRAFRIKETLREIFHNAQSAVQAEPLLDRWYSWARRCRLEPIKAVAKTLKGSLARFPQCVRFQAHQRPCRGSQFAHPGRQSQGPRLRDHQEPAPAANFSVHRQVEASPHDLSRVAMTRYPYQTLREPEKFKVPVRGRDASPVFRKVYA